MNKNITKIHILLLVIIIISSHIALSRIENAVDLENLRGNAVSAISNFIKKFIPSQSTPYIVEKIIEAPKEKIIKTEIQKITEITKEIIKERQNNTPLDGARDLDSVKSDLQSEILTAKNYLLNEMSSRYMSVPNYGASFRINNLDNLKITNGLTISDGQLSISSNEQIRQTGAGSVLFSGALTANKGAAVNGGNFTVNTNKFIIDYSTGDATIAGSATISGATAFSGTTTLTSITASGPLTVTSVQNSYITGGGYLGIGTTSPSELFAVNGQIYVSGNGTSTFHNGINLLDGCFAVDGICVSGGGSGTINSGAANRLSYYSGATTLDSANYLTTDITNGRLGVSSSTPWGHLSIDALSTAPNFVIGTTSGTRFIVDANGNIGVGTTSPSQLFSVNGHSYMTGGLGVGVATTTNGVIQTSGNIYTSGNLFVGGQATSTTLYISNKAGIGTTSPWALLSIDSSNDISIPTMVLKQGINQTTDLMQLRNYFGDNLVAFDAYGGISQNIGTTTLKIKSALNDPTNLNSNYDVYVSGHYAYIIASGRLTIVDIFNQSSTTLVSSIQDTANNEFDFSQSVFVAGQYAYIPSYNSDSLSVVDISNPSSPSIISTITSAFLDGVWDVSVLGKYAYVSAKSADRLTVIDISDPYNPSITGSVSDSTNLNGIRNVFISGKYAYHAAGDGDRFTVTDISDPANPKIAGSITDSVNLDSIRSIYVSGKYAYATAFNTDRLTIIDISKPTSLKIIKSVTSPYLDGAYDVKAHGRYAYVTAQNANSLVAIDITNPASSTIIASLQDSTNLNGVSNLFISGKYAYISATNGNRLTIIDLGGFDTPVINAGNIQANYIGVAESMDVGNSLYVKNGLNIGEGGLMTNGSVGIYASSSATVFTVSSKNSSNQGPIASFWDGATEVMRLDNQGNFGLGTTTPRSLLNIAGARPQLTLTDSSAGLNDKHWFISPQGGNLYIGTSTDALNATSTYLTINNKGNFGISTTSPWKAFSVNGAVAMAGLSAFESGDSALCLGANNEVHVNTGITSCIVSSLRFKHNINDLENGLLTLLALRPVTYLTNNTNDPRIGLIAEEVNEVESRLVAKDTDGTPKSVRYDEMVAVVIKAIQEHIISAFKKIETDTVKIHKGIEITDQTTGEIYCVTINNGEFEKIKDACH